VATGELGSTISDRRLFAGDGLLRPLPLIAIALLVVNDHVLKSAMPGIVTGKLSDFAGLIFFPLLLVAIAEVASSLFGFPVVGSHRVLATAVVVTGVIFAAVQLVPLATDGYRIGLGFAQWAVTAPLHALGSAGLGSPWRASLVGDPTDLIALLALPIAFLDGMRRCGSIGR
jgi:hypothetical protein